MCILCFSRYEVCRMNSGTVNTILICDDHHQLGNPIWFLYIGPLVKFLQVFNASINFPIYYLMGTSFRDTFHGMIKVGRHRPTQNGNGPGTGVR